MWGIGWSGEVDGEDVFGHVAGGLGGFCRWASRDGEVDVEIGHRIRLRGYLVNHAERKRKCNINIAW